MKLEAYSDGGALWTEKWTVENGQTVVHGQVVRVSPGGGATRRAISGTAVLGISNTRDDVTGDGTDDQYVEVIIATPRARFEVAQGALLDAAVQPGDNVDIALNALDLAADANHDAVVWQHDALNDLVYIQFIDCVYH
jgi:hypothetical protein